MEPLKPEIKKQLAQCSLQASPQDVEEYERLLSERFTVDPSRSAARSTAHVERLAAPNAVSPEEKREARLKELYQKLYPAGNL